MTSLGRLTPTAQIQVRLTIKTSFSRNKMTVHFVSYYALARWMMRKENYLLIGEIISIEGD